VAVAEALVLFAILHVVFGLGFVGDPTPFIVSTILYVFCVASFGTMIGATVTNQVAAMQGVMLGGFLFTFLLSGLLFPLSNVPDSLRWLSYLVWARYYIEIVRDALLQGGGWSAVWYKVLAIAAIGSVFFLMAWRRLRPMRLEV
ncbi:MAG: ABC transporter permease, partial [Vicinamibacterales bacterium]|nr:ABC transporter permease [Vicinamibacterales bacterium]